MTRFALTSIALAAGLSLTASLSAAEPDRFNGTTQVTPRDRSTHSAGTGSVENIGWTANGNRARLTQSVGQGNQAGFAQSGHANSATVVQTGHRNSAGVTQRGDNKRALIIQRGDDTDVTIDQHGDGPARAIIYTW